MSQKVQLWVLKQRWKMVQKIPLHICLNYTFAFGPSCVKRKHPFTVTPGVLCFPSSWSGTSRCISLSFSTTSSLLLKTGSVFSDFICHPIRALTATWRTRHPSRWLVWCWTHTLWQRGNQGCQAELDWSAKYRCLLLRALGGRSNAMTRTR